MGYNYIRNLVLDSIEKNKLLLEDIKKLINILDNLDNSSINNDIVKLVNSNNISQLNNNIIKESELIEKNINYSNFDTFINFLSIFINLYRYKVDIDNQYKYIYGLINIDYNNIYSITFTDNNLINDVINSIKDDYELYNKYNITIIQNIEKFYTNHIQKYLNEGELYKFVSNMLSMYPNIVNLYIILFNNGISNNYNKELYNSIIEIYNNDKDNVLGIKYDIKIKETIEIQNYLQTFNIVPKYLFDSNNTILGIKDIIYKIINIKADFTDDILNILKVSIKNYSNISKIPTAISLLTIGNKVDYVVEHLLDNSITVNTDEGLNHSIIKKFNTIIISNQKNNKKDKIININYTEDTQQCIILQTVDLNKFKVLYYKNNHLIPCSIFNKLIRNTPSKRIEKYNENFENIVTEYQSTKYVKQYLINRYLDFNVIEQNSNKLYKELSTNIINSIMSKFSKPNLTDMELFNLINDNKVSDIFNTHLNNFYDDIVANIDNVDKSLLNDIYISYLSLYANLLFKFNKILTDKYIYHNHNKDIDNVKKFNIIITETVGAIINERTDIYNYIIEKYNILKNYKRLI